MRTYAWVSDVNYGIGSTHKIIGDGGLAFALSDSARITAGGGTTAMGAFQTAQNHVTGTFASGDLRFAPARFAQLQAHYAPYDISTASNGIGPTWKRYSRSIRRHD